MAGTSSKWDGSVMSQNDFMEKDTVLVLDTKDNVVGSETKKAAHIFNTDQPRGVLHRAFSVFIFDESTNELLLQQRAASKITFPSVWTNTCCSHPLHGMEPPEIDTPEDVQNASVNGVKYAAIRKLDHELGIPNDQVPIGKFKFLTRLHYWAADTVTHGTKSTWGEHEIDYVLFLTVPSKSALTINPNPDEIDDIKWVTKSKLVSMMEDSNLLFSPWFRIIVKKWVLGGDSDRSKKGWWDDLSVTMNTDNFVDVKNIHPFDPPVEHMGGGGDAGPMFDAETKTIGDTSKKQGAYGKIKTHKESKVSQLSHFDEVWSAITLLYIKPMKSNLDSDFIKHTYDKDDLEFCHEILCKVSRSFAAVIRQLPPTLLVDVLIFYLVLRALDTVEDDMTAFESNEVKIQHLLNFHKTALMDPKWTMDGVGEADEKRLLQEFNKCHSIFAALKSDSKDVIMDITQRMATGMAEFVGKDLGQGTVDVKQYNRYCHFVAGLVGEGLSRLFATSGLENPGMAKELYLSDQMGLFLQKTNIIRDYLEDYVDGRAFWPQSIWKKYSKNGDLGYFSNQNDDEARVKSLYCLNELVTDALTLVPDCLAYLSKLKCSEVFRFCAIPQVMAIATLDKCFNNCDVFTGVVKIRKGLSCKLINNTLDIASVHQVFYDFAASISKKAEKAKLKGFDDPAFEQTMKVCENIRELTAAGANEKKTSAKMTMKLLSVAGVGLVFNQRAIVGSATALLIGRKIVNSFGLAVKTTLKPSHALLDDPAALNTNGSDQDMKKSQ